MLSVQARVLQVWAVQLLAVQQAPVRHWLLQQTCPVVQWVAALVQPQAPFWQI